MHSNVGCSLLAKVFYPFKFCNREERQQMEYDLAKPIFKYSVTHSDIAAEEKDRTIYLKANTYFSILIF